MSILDGPTEASTSPGVSVPRNPRGQLIAMSQFGEGMHARRAAGEWELVGEGTPYWDVLRHPLYRGVHASDIRIISGEHTVGEFYYRTVDSQWRGLFEQGTNLVWDDWNLRSALGDADAQDLHEHLDAASAYRAITNLSLTNYAFFDGQYHVFRQLRLFDGTVYVDTLPFSSRIVNADTPRGRLITPYTTLTDTQIGGGSKSMRTIGSWRIYRSRFRVGGRVRSSRG